MYYIDPTIGFQGLLTEVVELSNGTLVNIGFEPCELTHADIDLSNNAAYYNWLIAGLHYGYTTAEELDDLQKAKLSELNVIKEP
jgi:hypothetical protein